MARIKIYDAAGTGANMSRFGGVIDPDDVVTFLSSFSLGGGYYQYEYNIDGFEPADYYYAITYETSDATYLTQTTYFQSGDLSFSISDIFLEVGKLASQGVDYAYSGKDFIIGNSFDDKMFGYAGHDKIVGRSGNDTLIGMSGDDTLVGGAGFDNLKGETGSDVLKGGGGNDTLIGGAANDRLFGQSGNDKLIGGRGSDTLKGGKGDDTMSGGGGSDTFIFAANDGKDKIVKFNENSDHIRFIGANEIGDLTLIDRENAVEIIHGSTTVEVQGCTLDDLLDSDAFLW